MDLAGRLAAVERLGRLRDDGALTDEEFSDAKAKVLAGTSGPSRDDLESSELHDQHRSRGYEPSGAPKWIIGGAVVAALGLAAFFIAAPDSDGPDAPATTTQPTEEQPATAATDASAEPGDAGAALNAAEDALEAAGSNVEAAADTLEAPAAANSSVSVPPAPDPVTYEPKEAKPVRDLQSYVTGDDYPESSLQRGEQGSVAFTLTIDAYGRASDCTISSSSGYRSLDVTTCRIMMRRARFTPAYDASGQPVTGTVSSSIGWRIDG